MCSGSSLHVECILRLGMLCLSAWNACVVWLYNGVHIVVMSGDVLCCSVVCGTQVGVSVFSIMCSELSCS